MEHGLKKWPANGVMELDVGIWHQQPGRTNDSVSRALVHVEGCPALGN